MTRRAKPTVPPQVAGLWPAPAQVTTQRSDRPGETSYFVVPSLRRPRLLVPTDVKGAGRMFARHGGSRVDRAARSAWRRAHHSGLAAWLPLSRLTVSAKPDGIEAYLASALGKPVRIGVLLGPPRANLKPVIQIFDATGQTLGFAKLGLTPLTASLLATEAGALDLLARRTTRSFRAPAVLHHGLWKDTPILVQQALALAQSHHTTGEPSLDVMVEIAGLDGVTTESLRGSAFLDGLAPPADTTWHGLDMQPFTRLHAEVDRVDGCPFGSWHGDFGPWNMGSDGTVTEIWDWERFSVGVPVGFDAAHYRAQLGVAAMTDPDEAWDHMVRDVGAVLDASNLDRTVAPAVAAAYLLAICARYRGDAIEGPTAALRRRIQWLARVSRHATSTLEERSS